jgi:sugar phosphate isomerase/epimerase
MLRDRGLHLAVSIYADDIRDFAGQLETLMLYEPIRISSQSGRDSMTRDEGCSFFEQALAIEAKAGVDVAHETHRGRLLFAPWEAGYYLQRFPSLHINADFSHWVNVCERLPDDQAQAIDLACRRAIHIHGRVGYEEGPQAPDPSAREYERHLKWHEARWTAIRRAHEQAGSEYLTFTPEYGPPDYLHTLPHTRKPVADLWEVCLWAASRIRQLWPDIA